MGNEKNDYKKKELNGEEEEEMVWWWPTDLHLNDVLSLG